MPPQYRVKTVFRLPPRGFTLIELLIVVVIIGVLAAIAIPKFSSTRERAMVAAVISDLKIFASQQESYQSRTQAYASSLSDLVDFNLTEGVNISINHVDLGQGWAATGFHDGLPDRYCGIYDGTGNGAAASPATLPGVVACMP